MTFIVGWAFERGQYRLQKVLKHFRKHPRELRALMAYGAYAADRDKREAEAQKKEQERQAALAKKGRS